MDTPLVSIICLCYNQNRFVAETLDSVFLQTYKSIQLIVVDDGSEDGSQKTILEYLTRHPDTLFLNLEKNVGNTLAFNKGLEWAKGKYVVDLACDDVLVPDRIERQVRFFEAQPDRVGVIYSDAQYMDENGISLKTHFSNQRRMPYQGDIYDKVISTYFIPPQTMLMRKSVLDELGGYDGTLAYEDFDFWVRSSRNWQYAFQNEVLTKIRKVKGSHSSTFYRKGDLKLASTVLICKKIIKLNQSESENRALIQRLRYEHKHAVLTGNRAEAKDFYSLLKEIKGITLVDRAFRFIALLGVDVSYIRGVLVRNEI